MNNTGWVCPKCGTVNAPNMPTCFKCSLTNEQKEEKKSTQQPLNEG